MRLEAAIGQARVRMSQFNEWQMQIGNGVDDQGLPSDTVDIPDELIEESLDALIASVFPDLENPAPDAAILTPKNIGCDDVNEKIIEKIHGQISELLSVDTLLDVEDTVAPGARNLHHDYPVEYLNSLAFSGLPPHKLRLKLGCIVMLLRNMDFLQGLCNGVRLKVLEIGTRILKCEILTGTCAGNIALIPRIKLNPDDGSLPFPMQRLQFPVKLAYCITINKAQVQSLNRVGVYLDEDVFGHVQLYVAVSRARARSRLKFYLPPERTSNIIMNVVYRSALRFSTQ
jgi:ATP-dependent DNA helicase PIF1